MPEAAEVHGRRYDGDQLIDILGRAAARREAVPEPQAASLDPIADRASLLAVARPADAPRIAHVSSSRQAEELQKAGNHAEAPPAADAELLGCEADLQCGHDDPTVPIA
jgi:hypothetical protein